MEQKQINFFIIFFIIVIALTSYITFSYVNYESEESEESEEFTKYFNRGVDLSNDAEFEYADAEYNYALWSLYYDQDYLLESIDYCIEAREFYASANSYNQDAIANFEEADKIAEEEYKELISYHLKALDHAIEINWAMYEACEYFESASNYYDQELYETGDAELEIGNEKIDIHDSLIVSYNRYISKIDMLEEKS